MRKILKFLTVIFAAALILSAPGAGRCDDSATDLKTFTEQVMDIDRVGSLLTCRGEGEMTFYVPSGVKIIHGAEIVSLEYLQQEDDVLVKYVDDPTGRPKAVSMTLNKPYPEF